MDEFDGVAAAVLHVAHAAEDQTRGSSVDPYGRDMLRTLKTELGQGDMRFPGSDPADVRLLLGCAFDLTDACQIWWSDPFPIDTAEVAP